MKNTKKIIFEGMFLLSTVLIGVLYFTTPAQDIRYENSISFLENVKDFVIR